MAKIDDSIKKKVPELRFKGFTDDWEQRKLTEIVNRVNKSSNSDVLPKVEFEDIVSGEGRLNKDISSKFDSRKGTLFEPENILYGKLRPYLKNWLFSDFEGVALGDFWVFEATDVSVPSFDYYLIQSDNYQKVANDTSGTKMPRSDWKNVSSTDFAIPSKDEQKQIGAFFKQLDNTIVLHQRRLDLLKEQKKGYLQKMFPKNGAKVPELRFAGFADDWEERKLGEIGSFKNGMNFGKDAMGHGSPFVNLQNIFGKNIVEDTTLELAESTEKQKVEYSLIKGDVLFIRSSVKPSGVGEAALVDSNLPDTTYSGFIIRFRPKIDIDNNFKRFVFGTKYVRNQIMARATSSANTNINQDSLSLIQVGLPNLKEQEKIGSFFKHLDDTIALHQRKLDLLKEQKKGFLQKMFV